MTGADDATASDMPCHHSTLDDHQWHWQGDSDRDRNPRAFAILPMEVEPTRMPLAVAQVDTVTFLGMPALSGSTPSEFHTPLPEPTGATTEVFLVMHRVCASGSASGRRSAPLAVSPVTVCASVASDPTQHVATDTGSKGGTNNSDSPPLAVHHDSDTFLVDVDVDVGRRLQALLTRKQDLLVMLRACDDEEAQLRATLASCEHAHQPASGQTFDI
jgi:hypothetical protein